MNKQPTRTSIVKSLAIALALSVAGALPANASMPPKKGDSAPDLALKTLDDKPVELRTLTEKSRVVLIVLRGWPGYQCPICERQVRDLIHAAPELKKRGVQMLFVYPGPNDKLKLHAQEFLQNKHWPSDFIFVTDADYTFTKAYGLRWNAPNETAYPSTFIIGRDGKVQFAHISKEHGGRVSSKELLEQL
jgi:peroxiredoxin